MMSIRFIAAVLVMPLATQASEPPLSLEEAISKGVHEAPRVAAQVATLEASQSLVTSSGRLPDPQLILGVDNLPVTGADAGSLSRDFMTMRKVGVMQEFPRGEKRRLQRARATADADLAAAELLQARLQAARSVTEAWVWRATSETSLAHYMEIGRASCRERV